MAGNREVERSADLRYRGQGFELNVPFGKSLLADFHRQHEFRYGYQHPERAVELVTLRLRAGISVATLQPRSRPAIRLASRKRNLTARERRHLRTRSTGFRKMVLGSGGGYGIQRDDRCEIEHAIFRRSSRKSSNKRGKTKGAHAGRPMTVPWQRD